MGRDPEDSAPESLDPMERIAQQLERIGDRLDGFFRLSVLNSWNTYYRRLDDAITPKAVESMKTMLHEFVTREYSVEILRVTGINTLEQHLKRILLKQRVYEYLLFTRELIDASPGVFPDAEHATNRWLHELSYDRDFRMVHVRQREFYPQFTELIEGIFLEEAKRAREKRPAEAEEIRRAASLDEAKDAFKKYKGLKKKSIKRANYEQVALEHGLSVPLNKSGFIHLWLRWPDWTKHLD